MGEIAVVQLFLLRAFGFIPYSFNHKPSFISSRESTRQWRSFWIFLQKLISRGLILATTCQLLMEISTDVASSITVDRYDADIKSKNHEDPFIIRIISDLQYCFYPVRTVLILVLFLTKQSTWIELHQSVQNFIRFDDRGKIVRQMRLLSIVLSILTFLLHYTFVACQKMTSFNRRKQAHGPSFSVFDRDYCYNWGICLNFIENILFQGFTLYPAFFLSQQVLIYAVIFSVVILQEMKSLADDIRNEKIRANVALSQMGMMLWSVTLQRRVMQWTEKYISAQKLIDQLNETFTWILLISVSFDVLTALGLGAEVIQPHARLLPGQVAYNFVNSAVFVAYATLLFLPFALLHDQVYMYANASIFLSEVYFFCGLQSLTADFVSLPKSRPLKPVLNLLLTNFTFLIRLSFFSQSQRISHTLRDLLWAVEAIERTEKFRLCAKTLEKVHGFRLKSVSLHLTFTVLL